METTNSGSTKTTHGTVDQKALSKLRNGFDTGKLLKAIGLLDSIGSRCEFNEGGIRNDLLRLHAMAHELCNDGIGTHQLRPDETIYDLAQDLVDEISDWRLALRQLEKLLDQMVTLRPKDD